MSERKMNFKQFVKLWFLLALVTTGFYTFLNISHICQATSQRITDIKSNMYSSSDVLLYENKYDHLDPAYLEFVRRTYILKPSGKTPTLEDLHVNSDYSQVGQGLLVSKILDYKENGFFIECGAAGGELFSNTLFLELKYNWTGLLIEANPVFFQELLRTNRNAYMTNVCLATRNESSKQTFELYSWWGGLANHLENVNTEKPEMVVQCFPLHVLLLSLGVKRVHYLSLDVEGAELGVLRTIPFHLIHIDVIGIEYRVNNQGGTKAKIDVEKTQQKLKSIRDFFKRYEFYKEVGIIPVDGYETKTVENNGLDIFFQKVS